MYGHQSFHGSVELEGCWKLTVEQITVSHVAEPSFGEQLINIRCREQVRNTGELQAELIFVTIDRAQVGRELFCGRTCH